MLDDDDLLTEEDRAKPDVPAAGQSVRMRVAVLHCDEDEDEEMLMSSCSRRATDASSRGACNVRCYNSVVTFSHRVHLHASEREDTGGEGCREG